MRWTQSGSCTDTVQTSVSTENDVGVTDTSLATDWLGHNNPSPQTENVNIKPMSDWGMKKKSAFQSDYQANVTYSMKYVISDNVHSL